MTTICIGTQAAAQHALDLIEQVLAPTHFSTLGYTIIDNGGELAVVAKDAATGQDATGSLTTCWDHLKTAPDGRSWFYSPTDDLRFFEWKDRLPEGIVLDIEEIELPPDFLPSDPVI